MGRVFRRSWDKGKKTTPYYSLEYRDQHGKKHSHLATPRTRDRQVASDLLRVIENEIARGTYRPPSAGSEPTVRELLEEYEAYRRKRDGEETWADGSDRYQLDRIRKAPWIDHAAASLKPGAVLKWIDDTIGAKASKSARRYPATLLKAALNRAVVTGRLEHNPIASLRLPASKAIRTVTWDDREYRALLAALPAWARHVAEIARLTLLRERDVLELRWDQLDETYLRPWIRKGRKDGLPRRLTPELRAALPSRGKSPYLFPHPDSPRRPRSRHSFTWAMRSAKKKAGIAGKHFHDLRATGATALLSAGVPDRLIAALLDHADTSLVQRYAHVLQERADEAAALLGRPAAMARNSPQMPQERKKSRVRPESRPKRSAP